MKKTAKELCDDLLKELMEEKRKEGVFINGHKPECMCWICCGQPEYD